MSKKNLITLLCAVFIISLIPLYFIGGFAHPSVDDYYYGINTSAVWQSTGSFSEVIKESYNQMLATYQDWQGNFSAIFLMRLQPAIFGEQYYIVAPIILITSFILAMTGFMYILLSRWFHSGKAAALAASLCITFCALQFTHTPSDSFYWYNGSIYYTFFFCLMLLLFILLTIIIRGVHTSARIISFIAALPLAFCIGGGNYSTALYMTIILVVLCIYYIFQKRRVAIPTIAVTLFAVLGLVLSMIAPGNEIRQASVGEGSGVIKALLYSFAYGGYSIADSTTFPVAILWIVLLPVFYKIASNSVYSFRYPLLMLLFTFGIYSSQGTPVFYAQGLSIPYRMMNIIYFNYYIFMAFNLLYLMGYLSRRFGNSPVLKGISTLYESASRRNIIISCAAILFAIGCIGLINVTETSEDSGKASFSHMPASISATYSLISGDAAQYDRELNERDKYLSTTSDIEITLEPLSVTPELIFHTDITTRADHWKNMHMSLYYNKISIKLSE